MRPLMVIIIAAALAGCATPVSRQVKKAGYEPVMLGSEIYEPGTVFNAATGQPICMPQTEYAPGATLISADAASETVAKYFSGDLLLDVKADELVSGDVNAKYVRNVSMTFDRVKEEFFSAADVAKHATKNQDIDCSAKLAETPRDSLKVVLRALRADVVASVQFDAGAKLSAEAQKAISEKIAAKLKMEVAAGSNSVLHGKSLYWGIMPDGADSVEINRCTRHLDLIAVAVQANPHGDEIELPHSVTSNSPKKFDALPARGRIGRITTATSPAPQPATLSPGVSNPDYWGYINGVSPHETDPRQLVINGALSDKFSPPGKVTLYMTVPVTPVLPAGTAADECTR